MAKTQRSLLLDEALMQAINAHQEGTGATFTRIIGAGMLQYLFSNWKGPDPEWMRMAMALERGDLAFEDIPLALTEARLKDAKEMAGPDAKPPDQEISDDEAIALLRKYHEVEMRNARRAKAQWEHWFAQAETKMDALLEHFRQSRGQGKIYTDEPFGAPDSL